MTGLSEALYDDRGQGDGAVVGLDWLSGAPARSCYNLAKSIL